MINLKELTLEELFKYQADRWRECAILWALCEFHLKECAEKLEKASELASGLRVVNGKGIKG